MQSLRRNAQTLSAEFIFARLAWARLVPLFTWRNILARWRCRFQSRAWSNPLQRTRANRPSYYLSTINDCDFKRCPRFRPCGEAGIQWLLPRLTHATFLVVCHGERRKGAQPCLRDATWRGSLTDACSLTRGISDAHKRRRMIDLRASSLSCMGFFGHKKPFF